MIARFWTTAIFLFASIACIEPCAAQTPSPGTPTSTPSPNSAVSPEPQTSAPPAAPHQIPWTTDPCAGPQEILGKYGPTPCVVVAGEALFSAGYTSAKINGTITISGRALPNLQATTSALIRAYPAPQAVVGLGPLTDIDIIAPTYVRVDTVHTPLAVSGDTDWKFSVKQRIQFDPASGTITAVDAGVQFPTGSPPLRAAAPIYSFDLIGEKAWPNGFAVVYVMQLVDSPSPTGGRQWTLSPTILPAWARGNTLYGAGVVILPNGKAIPMALVEQLFNRHFGITVTYAGMGASGFTSTTQPGLPILNAITVNGNVNAVNVSLVGLLGQSGP